MASGKVDKWLTDDGLLLLECWARDFALQDISKKMGISDKALWEWRKRYPEINEALSRGKEIVDYQVENALLKVALGYKTKEVKVLMERDPDGKGNRKIKKEVTEKEIGPNVTAIMAWLNNRKPDSWKRNRDNIITNDDKDNNITVNIIRKGKQEDDNEEWEVSAKSSNSSNVIKKGSTKANENDDSDYVEYSDDGSWPDDWEEGDE